MRPDRQRALAIDGDSAENAKSIRLPPGFRSPLLEGLTPSEIKAVLAAATERRIFPHQVIRHEGDPATRLFLLVTGRAAHYNLTDEGRKLFLRWIVPGDAFGLFTLRRDSPPSLTTVQAVKEGSVLVWDKASARALFSQYPQQRQNT